MSEPMTYFTMQSMIQTIVAVFLLSLCHGALIEQTWTITHKVIRPDGVTKLVPVVNGQYPGPQLRANAGDRVRITVVNKLASDTTSIHWHGIKQFGTPFSDGVPGITQCPIGPGQSFVYDFVVDAPGTLWWHSHSTFQKSSLYGAIIIRGDEKQIGAFEERTLLLNDWFHEGTDEQLEGLTRQRGMFKWVGDPQSLLLNGLGTFNCTQTSKECDPKAEGTGRFIMDVEPGKTYRVRVVGASSLSYMNLGIDDHEMQVVEVETDLIQPFHTKWIDIGSGQSLSFLLRTKTVQQLREMGNNNGLFYIQLNIRHRKNGPQELGILRYSTSNATTPQDGPDENWPGREDVQWSLQHARRYKSKRAVNIPDANRVITILGTQNELPDGRLGWAMNNVSHKETSTPLLHSMALDLQSELSQFVSVGDIPTPFDYNQTLSEAGLSEVARLETHVIKVDKDEVVDIIFQNTRTLGGAHEVHPWHLHLHNFWVLGFGEEHSTWTPKDEQSYDLRRALSRNTFTLYPASWTAIRVRFDNPDCHILPHLAMGMGFVIQVGDANDLPPIPQGTQFCGTVTKLMAPPVRNPLVMGAWFEIGIKGLNELRNFCRRSFRSNLEAIMVFTVAVLGSFLAFYRSCRVVRSLYKILANHNPILKLSLLKR